MLLSLICQVPSELWYTGGGWPEAESDGGMPYMHLYHSNVSGLCLEPD